MTFTTTELTNLLDTGKDNATLGYGANTGLRARKRTNRISFIVSKRVAGTKTNSSTTIGYFPDISIKEALNRAHAIRDVADQGRNPRVVKLEKARKVAKGQITFQECIDEYVKDLNTASDKPLPVSTTRGRESAFRNVSPTLLRIPIAEISQEQLRERFDYYSSSQHKKRNGETGARRQAEVWMSYTKAVFKMAHEIKNYIDFNPCPKAFYKIKRIYKEYDHYLQPSETSKLLLLISDLEKYADTFDKDAVTEERLNAYQAIKLTLLTGLHNYVDVYQILWKDVKLNKTNPSFYYFNTKNQQPMEVPITPIMKEVFDAQAKRKRNQFVFPQRYYVNRSEDDHLTTVRKPLLKLRELLEEQHGIKDFKTSKVFNNLMLRHTFMTLGSHIHIPIEELDTMSGHIITRQRKKSTGFYITNLAETMRSNFNKLHEYMLAGIDPEGQEVSEETVQLKRKSIAQTLNTTKARARIHQYFKDKYPLSYLALARRILQVSTHHYSRFYEGIIQERKDKRFKEEGREYEPVIRYTGYLVELPNYLVKTKAQHIKSDHVTLFYVTEFEENRSEIMTKENISEMELDEQDTMDEEGRFRMGVIQDKIREELGDPYRRKQFYTELPKEKLTENKDRWFKIWNEWKKAGGAKNPEWLYRPNEVHWKRKVAQGRELFIGDTILNTDNQKNTTRLLWNRLMSITKKDESKDAQELRQRLLELQKTGKEEYQSYKIKS